MYYYFKQIDEREYIKRNLQKQMYKNIFQETHIKFVCRNCLNIFKYSRWPHQMKLCYQIFVNMFPYHNNSKMIKTSSVSPKVVSIRNIETRACHNIAYTGQQTMLKAIKASGNIILDVLSNESAFQRVVAIASVSVAAGRSLVGGRLTSLFLIQNID